MTLSLGLTNIIIPMIFTHYDSRRNTKYIASAATQRKPRPNIINSLSNFLTSQIKYSDLLNFTNFSNIVKTTQSLVSTYSYL